jgi:hypothetical protein
VPSLVEDLLPVLKTIEIKKNASFLPGGKLAQPTSTESPGIYPLTCSHCPAMSGFSRETDPTEWVCVWRWGGETDFKELSHTILEVRSPKWEGEPSSWRSREKSKL